MTLIVATDEPDSGFFASQIISELMREHPSRGIVLAVDESAGQAVKWIVRLLGAVLSLIVVTERGSCRS